MRQLFIIFLFFTLCNISCNKDITVDNTDKNFPLSLAFSQQGDVTTFTWEEGNTSGFEKFVLVRSGVPIPAGGVPFGGSNFTVFESNDSKTVSATDGGVFFDSVGYYKLYMSLNGRWLESNEVAVRNKMVVLDGAYFGSYFLPDSNWVVVLTIDQNSGAGKMSLVDYKNSRHFDSNLTLSLFSQDQVGLSIGYSGGKPEAWFWSFTGYVQARLPELTPIKNASVTSITQYSIAAGGGDVMLTTQNSISSSFNVRKRSNLSIIKSYTRQNYFDHRTLLMLDTATNLMVEIGPGRIDRFSLNASTGVINSASQMSLNTAGFAPFLMDIPVSYDREYFCPHVDDVIYDRNLQVVLNNFLPSGENLLDLTFAKDGQYIYALTSSFNSTFVIQIDKIAFPGGQVVETRPMSLQPTRIMRTDGGIMTIISSAGKTAIKKIAF